MKNKIAHVLTLSILTATATLSAQEIQTDTAEELTFLEVNATLQNREKSFESFQKQFAEIECSAQEATFLLATALNARKYPEAAELIKSGADVFYTDMEGNMIYHAAQSDSIAWVQFFIDRGISPTAQGRGGRHETPLFPAAAHQNPEMIQLLLKYKCNPLVQNTDGNTAFAEIFKKPIHERALQCIALLNPNNANYTGLKHPIYIAIESQNQTGVDFWLRKGFNPQSVYNSDLLWSPIECAAASCDSEFINYLISQNFNPFPCEVPIQQRGRSVSSIMENTNVPQFHISNPLYHAVFNGNLEGVQAIIHAGVPPIQNENDYMLFIHGLKSPEIFKYLYQKVNNPEQICLRSYYAPRLMSELVKESDTTILDYILHNAPNPDFKLVFAHSFLNEAIMSGEYNAIDRICKSGIDLTDIEKNYGFIFAISFRPHIEVLKKLKTYGLDFPSMRIGGGNVFHAIAGTFSVDAKQAEAIVKFFIDENIDINEVDVNDETPLTLAISIYNSQMIEPLIRHGANINRLNNMGKTPLMLAIERRKFNAAQQLIKAKADVTLRDTMGRTARDYVSTYIADIEERNAMLQRIEEATTNP